MQDVRIQPPTHTTTRTEHRRRTDTPPDISYSCNVGHIKKTQSVPRSSSSEEDNSPTEMNNCRRLIDKPPLVKRLAMGLLRSTEDSRPLVKTVTSVPLISDSSQIMSEGYVNEAICEPDKALSNKFDDSCRLHSADTRQRLHTDFAYKKKYARGMTSVNSSPKIFIPDPTLYFNDLKMSEQMDLKGDAWFQAGLPREISLEVLSRQSPGAFLVRQSSTKPGCFALSLRVPPPAPKVAHYLILRTQFGYKIQGFTKEFTSLRALITHHSVMPELLPVPLALPRSILTAAHSNSRNPDRHNNGSSDDFETYGSLNDFCTMMSGLNI